MNVIDSNKRKHDVVRKSVPTFRHCALGFAALVLVTASASLSHAGSSTHAAPTILAQADPDAVPDEAQGGADAASLLIRITRLEDQLRTLTGQVEQLQFQNKKLDDQMRKMQQDVDFRFQDLTRQPGTGPRPALQKRGDAAVPNTDGPATADAGPAAPQAVTVEAPKPAKRVGDAFDPNSNPDAPGAPRPIGTTPPSQPLPASGTNLAGQTPPPAAPALATAPHAPLDLTPNKLAAAQIAPPVAVLPADPGDSLSGAPAAGGVRGDYEGTFALYKAGQYDAAIDGFETFLQKYPKDRLVPDATYFLGESFARQGRHREAAEQFLKLSTDYSTSNRAPDALLRLGVALNALGAREQACATYQEVDRKFPSASSIVRASVERELKRAKC